MLCYGRRPSSISRSFAPHPHPLTTHYTFIRIYTCFEIPYCIFFLFLRIHDLFFLRLLFCDLFVLRRSPFCT